MNIMFVFFFTFVFFFFFKQKTAYEIGLGIPAEPLFRSIILIANIRKLAAERPLKDIRDEYNYPKKKGIKDECSRLLRSEERRVGKSVDLGGRRVIKKKIKNKW